MKNKYEKTHYYLNISWMITLISSLAFLSAFIYFGIVQPFAYWYLISLIVVPQLVLTSYYLYLCYRIDVYQLRNQNSVNKQILIIALLFIPTLNFFGFVTIILVYNKLNQKLVLLD